MCTGAILLSRIKNLFFGTFEPKFGACGSIYNIIDENKYNHQINVYSGIYPDEIKNIMQKYFRKKREKGVLY
jgi:tRNA(adenine34) deaminase